MKVFDFKKRETPRSLSRLYYVIYIKHFYMSFNEIHENVTRQNLP